MEETWGILKSLNPEKSADISLYNEVISIGIFIDKKYKY